MTTGGRVATAAARHGAEIALDGAETGAGIVAPDLVNAVGHPVAVSPAAHRPGAQDADLMTRELTSRG